ncbi:MAG: DNA topoisomerase [Myxococcota bacterium]|nr:DNA topoisomerase [Myxococcota bacterium]
MTKSLVITEKPSVARDVVEALGGFQEMEGYWERNDMLVTFAVGHLFELPAPEDLDEKYKRWTLDTLPILPLKFALKPKESHTERINLIGSLLQTEGLSSVINACDAGREGELIFREIVDYFETPLELKRIWLQSMTKSAIRTGFDNLQPGEKYNGLRDAAYCRTHADWLIGMNATRALTRRLKTRSENQAWSAGRVQTPTLAMLVEREFEILQHVPRAYWKITATFRASDHEYEGLWFDPAVKTSDEDPHIKPERIFDRTRAEEILAKIASKPGVASEVRKPSKESAPPLFDLTSLQREANRRLGWSARRTLNAAQRCYEAHKVLTYPRTDARALPEDYRDTVNEIITNLASNPDHTVTATLLLNDGLTNESKIFDNSKVRDHFAIIPTGSNPEEPLQGDDARLYDLVTRRFLAAFCKPAIWSRIERTTVVEGESFKTRARILIEPGWRLALGQTADPKESGDKLQPLVAGEDRPEGIGVQDVSHELLEEETKPPARITEGRLLSLMEHAGNQIDDEDMADALRDKGIGTPATRADIIENLIRKGYIDRVAKALRPSVKGIRLIDILHRMEVESLASPRLTADIENDLGLVEQSNRKPDSFMDRIRDYATDIVERTRTFEFEDLFPDKEELGGCPMCDKPVYERSWFYRCKEPANLDEMRKVQQEWDRKNRRRKNPETPRPEIDDCSFRIWKDKSGRYVDRSSVVELLTEGKTRVLDGFATRQGRGYKAQLYLDDENSTAVNIISEDGEGNDDIVLPEYGVDPRPLGNCPNCEGGEWVETKYSFICSKGKAALKQLDKEEWTMTVLKKKEQAEVEDYCPSLLPRTVCKREITREEAQHYLVTGKTEQLTDFISRRGRPFSAFLFLKDTGRHGFEFPPRASAAGGSTKKKATKKKTTKKKTTKKKAAKKKTTKKKATKKKTTKKKVTKKKTTKKKVTKKKATKKKVTKKVAVDTPQAGTEGTES